MAELKGSLTVKSLRPNLCFVYLCRLIYAINGHVYLLRHSQWCNLHFAVQNYNCHYYSWGISTGPVQFVNLATFNQESDCL